MSTILVTGGAGYIGTHTLISLLGAGYHPVVIDNFQNSKPEALSRVRQITGREVPVYAADVRDERTLARIFHEHPIDAVIHFAGLKAVGESVRMPVSYYDNNLISTLRLIQAMDQHGCRRLVFSSSATVYGDPARLPLTEDAPLSATNPYGRSKLIIEDMLRDLAIAARLGGDAAGTAWQIALLRYFNPVGAHPSGMIGEDPNGIPNNLFPYIQQVAVGRLKELQIFGADYPTTDGTGVRDYIHVMDLAEGHVEAVRFLLGGRGAAAPGGSFAEAINLGTGSGVSVLQAVRAFEAASGKQIPFRMAPRRPGDVAACFADAGKAARLLGWTARRKLADMCEDAWRWQSLNPLGFAQG